MHSTDELPKIKTAVKSDENFQVQKKLKWHFTIPQNSNFFQIMKNANEYGLNQMQHRNTSQAGLRK